MKGPERGAEGPQAPAEVFVLHKGTQVRQHSLVFLSQFFKSINARAFFFHRFLAPLTRIIHERSAFVNNAPTGGASVAPVGFDRPLSRPPQG